MDAVENKVYSREQIKARKERKALKTNNKMAVICFIISLLIFLPMAYVTIELGIILLEPTLYGATFTTAFIEALSAMGTAGGVVLIFYLAMIFTYIILAMTMIIPFFYALSLRRGNKKRHKKFFSVIAIIFAISAVLMLFGLGTDIATVIIYLFTFSLIGIITMLLMKWAHGASLFEAKRRGLRRKEEGKLHGGVWFIYALVNGSIVLMALLGDVLPENALAIVWAAEVALCVLMIFVAYCKRARYARIERREDRERRKELEMYEQSLMNAEEECLEEGYNFNCSNT
jgi:hypothetical protein